MRTSPGAVRRSCSGNFGNSSSKPVIRLAAAAIRKDRPPPTVTSQRATASARRPAMPRKNTAGSLRTGNSNRQRGARAPQMRCDDHRLRDRAGTSTLLFATWSPERQWRNIIAIAVHLRTRRIAPCSLRQGQASPVARRPRGQLISLCASLLPLPVRTETSERGFQKELSAMWVGKGLVKHIRIVFGLIERCRFRRPQALGIAHCVAKAVCTERLVLAGLAGICAKQACLERARVRSSNLICCLAAALPHRP